MLKLRIEVKRHGVPVMQVTCLPGISDGDLATMLEDAEQDLRWNVMKDAETLYVKPEG